jgi:hypothetical protein
MRKILVPLLAASLAAPALAAPAQPQSATAAQEVRIPFPSFRIRNFHADGRNVVYLEDRSRKWYRAELIGPCDGLPFARAIGIDARGGASFDKFSAIIVDGDRCQLTSLTRSEKPQKGKSKKRADA